MFNRAQALAERKAEADITLPTGPQLHPCSVTRTEASTEADVDAHKAEAAAASDTLQHHYSSTASAPSMSGCESNAIATTGAFTTAGVFTTAADVHEEHEGPLHGHQPAPGHVGVGLLARASYGFTEADVQGEQEVKDHIAPGNLHGLQPVVVRAMGRGVRGGRGHGRGRGRRVSERGGERGGERGAEWGSEKRDIRSFLGQAATSVDSPTTRTQAGELNTQTLAGEMEDWQQQQQQQQQQGNEQGREEGAGVHRDCEYGECENGQKIRFCSDNVTTERCEPATAGRVDGKNSLWREAAGGSRQSRVCRGAGEEEERGESETEYREKLLLEANDEPRSEQQQQYDSTFNSTHPAATVSFSEASSASQPDGRQPSCAPLSEVGGWSCQSPVGRSCEEASGVRMVREVEGAEELAEDDSDKQFDLSTVDVLQQERILAACRRDRHEFQDGDISVRNPGRGGRMVDSVGARRGEKRRHGGREDRGGRRVHAQNVEDSKSRQQTLFGSLFKRK